MNCKNCGNELREGQLFCPKCGTKAEPAARCPGCGASLMPGTKFCGVCGAPTTPSKPAVKPAVSVKPALSVKPKKKSLPGWAIVLIIAGALLAVGGIVVGGLAIAGVFDAPPAYVENGESEPAPTFSPAPSPEAAPSPAYSEAENLCGNVAGGFMSFDGEYVYLYDPGELFGFDTEGLVRMKPDGSEPTLLLSDVYAKYIQVVKGRVYYYDNDRKAVMSLPCEGGVPAVIADISPDAMQVTEDSVYCSGLNIGSICRIPLTGDEPHTVVDTAASRFWLTEDGLLVYICWNEDRNELRVLDTNTGEDSMLYSGRIPYAVAEDGYVYFYEYEGETIMSAEIATGEVTVLYSHPDNIYFSAFNVYGDYIYFSIGGSANLFRIPKDGNGIQLLWDADLVNQIYVTESSIYLVTDFGIYCCSDGSDDFSLILGEPPVEPAPPAPDPEPSATPAPAASGTLLSDTALERYMTDCWITAEQMYSDKYQCAHFFSDGSMESWFTTSPSGYGDRISESSGSWWVEGELLYIAFDDDAVPYTAAAIRDNECYLSLADGSLGYNFYRMS